MSKKQRREIPCFDQPITETHCHLDYLDGDELSRELEAARAVGVRDIVTIAVSPDNLATVREIAAREDRVWCTQGIHPHEAEQFNDEVADAIGSGCEDPRVVAVGEIGLDYYYDHAERSVQRAVFARQLAIAADRDLPVVIHTRDADEDTWSILAEHLSHLPRRGVIHSFSSGLALAERCLDAGFMLGFNGMVTFNRADNVREAVALAPLEQIVLETDSPYLTPVPYRGRSNGPRFLPFIAERVADIKAVEVDELLLATNANSQRLFFADNAGSRVN